jgi:hypothetical protein
MLFPYCLVFFVAVEFVTITVFEVNVETPFSTPRRFTTIKEITTGLEKEGQQTPESRARSLDLRLELPDDWVDRGGLSSDTPIHRLRSRPC